MSKTNYHDFTVSDIICPYYRRLMKKAICCEGFQRYSVNRTYFAKSDKLEAYTRKYCCSFNYPRCHWAILLNDLKYPDGGVKRVGWQVGGK